MERPIRSSLTHDEMERLAFVRYLLYKAFEESKSGYPFSGAAILTLHDCIELFCQAVADRPGTNIKNNPAFMEYWAMQLPGGAKLPGHSFAGKLTKLRANLKHGGAVPRKEEIGRMCDGAKTFLEDAALLAFGFPLDGIAMSALILDDEGRREVELAEEKAKAGELDEAINHLGLAFQYLLVSFNRIDREILGRPPREPYSRVPHRIESADLRDYLERLEARINDMAEMLEYLLLGLDFRDYVRFRKIGPYIATYLADNQRGFRFEITGDSVGHTSEEYVFCYEFVIQFALAVQRTASIA